MVAVLRALLCATLCVMIPAVGINGQQQNSEVEQQPGSTSVGIRLPGTALTVEAPLITVELLPHITIGSHAQAFGAHATAHISLPEILILKHFYFFLQAGYFYSTDNLGIPEPSHTGFFSGAVGFSVGARGTLDNNFIPLGRRRHNTIFQYEYFLDSIGTSQALVITSYYYSQPTWMIGVTVENDAFCVYAERSIPYFGSGNYHIIQHK